MIALTDFFGLMLHQTVEKAILLAKKENDEVSFTFNDIQLVVNKNSYGRDICEIYDLKCQISRLKSSHLF